MPKKAPREYGIQVSGRAIYKQSRPILEIANTSQKPEEPQGMTESEAVADLVARCSALAENDSIGGHAQLPKMFERLGTVIEFQQANIKSLQGKVSKLTKQIKELESRS